MDARIDVISEDDMLVVTTMFLAVLTLALIYFFVIRRWSSPVPGYLAIGLTGALCLLGGSVHLIYVGVEILVFGVLLMLAHQRWWGPSKEAPAR